MLAGALLLAAPLAAQTSTWSGATDTNWNTAANWSPTSVPSGTGDVYIDLQTKMPVLSSGTTNIGTYALWVGYLNVASGVSPAATFTIESGARLFSGQGNIGANSAYGDSPGAVTVTGANSKWTNDQIIMGYGPNVAGNGGSLSVLNGGSVVTNANAVVGYSGTATATVDGAGSRWTVSSGLQVGDGSSVGTSSLTISNGGYVSTGGNTNIATIWDSSGTVSVTGANSQWDSRGDIYVGGSGAGTLTISGGAKINMPNGGDADIGYGIYSSSGQSSATITGAGSAWNAFGVHVGGTYSAGTLTISNGGSLTSTQARLDSVTGSAGSAAVSIFGQGSTWVNTGNDQQFDIGANGYGSLTLGSGGRLTTSGITLGSGSELHFQLGGTSALTDYGSINFATGATLASLGGLLDVTLVNSFNPSPGATFHLFNFNGVTVSGTFATVTLPTLSNGETWDISGLYTNGAITVDAAAVPEPPSAAALLGAVILGIALHRRTRICLS